MMNQRMFLCGLTVTLTPLLADLQGFVSDCRPHGSLIADATEPPWNGYLLTVAPASR
jgi:hypothetical protein